MVGGDLYANNCWQDTRPTGYLHSSAPPRWWRSELGISLTRLHICMQKVRSFCDENLGPARRFPSLLKARGFGESGGVRCWSEVLGVRWRRHVGATGRSAALAMDLRRSERVFRS